MSACHRTLIGAAILAIAIATTASNAGAQDLGARIDAYLEQRIEANGIPGLTVAAVRDGTVVYRGAFGVRRLGGGEPLTPDHVFHLASVSKPFVATAIVQLAEQGRLDLDDHATEYLPYFRLTDERYTDITIREMLNHTSGMVDVEDYEWDSPQYDEGAAERFVRGMANDGMRWAPGAGYRYSNKAFDALGDLIAKVSGMSFEAYVQAHILDPIGMTGSSFVYPDIDESLRTTGHVGSPARVSDVYPYNRRHAPSSTLNSSVSQMTNWLLVNLGRGELDGHRILSPESYDLLWTSTTDDVEGAPSVGLSWFLYEEEGHSFVTHGGGDTGFRSFILLMPDEEIGVILASNWTGTDADEMAFEIAHMVLGTAQSDTDVEQIRARRAQSNDAIARHDVPGILSFLDDEFQVTAGSGAMLQSGQAMGSALTRQFERYNDVRYVRTIESVEISTSAPLAAEVGTWVGTWTTPGGPVRTGGRYTASWRDTDGGWVIRSELFVTLFCEGAGCE